MSSLLDFRERFGRMRILWQTRLGGYCLGLDEFVPIAVILALDDGQDFEAMARHNGIKFHSFEGTIGRRNDLDDLGIDWLIPALQQGVIAEIEQEPAAEWAAVSPYPSRTLGELSARLGIPCRCPDWATFWRFNRKVTLFDAVTELGLPHLPGRWTRWSRTGYPELASRFGSKFVAQLDVGAGGTGTVIVDSEGAYAAASADLGDSEVWVSSYAGSLSFNVNAIATRQGTAVGYPSVQIVGQAALRSRQAGHCGNDFSAAASVPRALLESIREQTSRIGVWMARQGFHGLFGLDFVVCDATAEACAVDLNPRWQGSTSLEAQAERRQGRVPLAAVELAYQLGLADDGEVMQMADSFFEPLNGSQIFPKNYSPGTWVANGELDAGVYSSNLTLVRPGLRLHDLSSPEEVLLTGGIPRPGRPMESGVTLLRISSLRAAVEPHSGRIHPWVEETVRSLYDSLDLRQAASSRHQAL